MSTSETIVPNYRSDPARLLAPQPIPSNVAPIPPGMRSWEQGPVQTGGGADLWMILIVCLVLGFFVIPLAILLWAAWS
jgi:hypothetical protein